MKLPLSFTLPFSFIAASCSNHTAKTEEPPAPTPPPTEQPAPKPTPTTPSTSTTSTVAPASIDPKVSFMDPNTTNELLTDKNKKTVSGPVVPLAPSPQQEDDSTIDIDLPTPPTFTEPVIK